MVGEVWKVTGRWTADGRSATDEFLVFADHGREQAQATGLTKLVSLAPNADKVLAEILELEHLGVVR